MKSEITEISYSTALTFELVTQYGFLTLGAPTFPSLRKDAIFKAGGGDQALLVFLQYKLGDHILGNTSALKGFWGVPYYRFQLQPRRKIERHALLHGLQALGHPVYYVAPEFHSMSGLYASLMATRVLEASTFWPPQAIGEVSHPDRVTIAYKPAISYGVLQPGKIKIDAILKGTGLLEALRSRFSSGGPGRCDEERLLRTGDRMLALYQEVYPSQNQKRLIDDIRLGRERIDARDYLSMISILLFNCYVYVVTRP